MKYSCLSFADRIPPKSVNKKGENPQRLSQNCAFVYRICQPGHNLTLWMSNLYKAPRFRHELVFCGVCTSAEDHVCEKNLMWNSASAVNTGDKKQHPAGSASGRVHELSITNLGRRCCVHVTDLSSCTMQPQ